jgi:hemoglobin
MSIYDRIGGGAAVATAVDAFYSRVLADSELAPYFDGIDINRLKAHQRAFIAAAIGGPEHYDGRSMADAHASLGVTPRAFTRVVEHLVATLEELGVDEPTIGTIGATLAPLQADIVTADEPTLDSA